MVTIRDVEVYPISDLATAKASPWASVSIIVRVVTSDGQVDAKHVRRGFFLTPYRRHWEN